MARIVIEGADKLQRALRDLQHQYPDRLMDALHDEALDIFAESQRLVPEDTSALKLSGYVKPEGKGVEIGYGNKDGGPVDYAVSVHEGPQKRWQKAGASNKYLEIPFKQKQRGMPERLAAKVRE